MNNFIKQNVTTNCFISFTYVIKPKVTNTVVHLSIVCL